MVFNTIVHCENLNVKKTSVFSQKVMGSNLRPATNSHYRVREARAGAVEMITKPSTYGNTDVSPNNVI